MKVEKLLEYIETDHIKFEHIEEPDLTSIALVKRGVGGFSIPASEPIIDVCVKKVKANRCLDKHRGNGSNNEIDIVCLITSDLKEDADKALNLGQVISKLKEVDAKLGVYEAYKDWDINGVFCNIINFDGSGIRDNHCERENMPKDYKGNITDFWC